MLRFMPGNAVDLDRVKILAGLIELRKDGHLAEIYADRGILRVRWEVDTPIQLLGWLSAARMVAQARDAARLASISYQPPAKIPPGRELSQRAQRAKARLKSARA